MTEDQGNKKTVQPSSKFLFQKSLEAAGPKQLAKGYTHTH